MAKAKKYRKRVGFCKRVQNWKSDSKTMKILRNGMQKEIDRLTRIYNRHRAKSK